MAGTGCWPAAASLRPGQQWLAPALARQKVAGSPMPRQRLTLAPTVRGALLLDTIELVDSDRVIVDVDKRCRDGESLSSVVAFAAEASVRPKPIHGAHAPFT